MFRSHFNFSSSYSSFLLLAFSSTRCHSTISETTNSESPPQKIISPADLAKRKARGEVVDESSLTPRSRFNVNKNSGARREALKLYRNLLKVSQDATEAKAKTDSSSSSEKSPPRLNSQQQYIRQQFLQNRNIPRANIEKIQYHIHHGQTKLEELEKNKKYHSGFKILTFN
jgi:hypothetical protein